MRLMQGASPRSKDDPLDCEFSLNYKPHGEDELFNEVTVDDQYSEIAQGMDDERQLARGRPICCAEAYVSRRVCRWIAAYASFA